MAVVHQPVLVDEILKFLDPKPGRVYVDGTLGNAGHALSVLEKSSPNGFLIGIDRDEEILKIAQERLKSFEERVCLFQENFAATGVVLKKAGFEKVDGIYLDLGVSSLQFDTAARGFSFSKEGPLDMRMNQTSGEPVLDKLQNTNERELTDILKTYGEERLAPKIARGILEKLKRNELKTTLDLAAVAWSAYPPKSRYKRPHPATRTFQALRIWVNEELGELQNFLKEAPQFLKPDGRLAIISYHSLEDRLVKRAFRQAKEEGNFAILTKKPVIPSDAEVQNNSRARSAKLRAMKRLA